MTILLEKKTNKPFDPTPGVMGKCKSKLFADMLLYASFPLIEYGT